MSFSDWIKAANEPLTKLIDCVSKAIGKTYEPRYIRKMADAKAYELRTIGEEIRNNSNLPIVFNYDAMSIDISDNEELVKRVNNRLIFQECKKQLNIESILDKASIELENKKMESNEDVNPDWMTRFISISADVNDEDIQFIWAKVLAGEILSPKSFSLRTLECLRNLNSSDAKLFEKVSNFTIEDSFVFNDKDLNEKNGIEYSDILNLDECGLINSAGLITLNRTIGTDRTLIIDFGKYVLLGSSSKETTVRIYDFPLSRAGKELLKIVSKDDIPFDYIKGISTSLAKSNKDVTFELCSVLSRNSDDTIGFDKTNLMAN